MGFLESFCFIWLGGLWLFAFKSVPTTTTAPQHSGLFVNKHLKFARDWMSLVCDMTMNVKQLLVTVLMASAVAFSGCGKKQSSDPSAFEISGVKVDLPKLEKALEANPELLIVVNNAKLEVRYGRFLEAMQVLDKLSNNPALNDTQKKVVTDVIGQFKQVVEKAGPARP